MVDSTDTSEVPVEQLPEELIPGAQVPASDLPDEFQLSKVPETISTVAGDDKPFQVSKVPGVQDAVGDVETADSVQPYHGVMDPISLAVNPAVSKLVGMAAEPFEEIVGNELGSIGSDIVGLTGNETDKEALEKISTAAKQGKLTLQQEMQAKSPFISKEATRARKAGGTVATKPPMFTAYADGGIVGDEVPADQLPDNLPTDQPSGDEVPADQLPDNLPGSGISDAERYSGVVPAITAGLTAIPGFGAAYKAIGNLTGGALGASGSEIAGLQAAHPTASTVGNVAGSLAELGIAPEIGGESLAGQVLGGAAKLGTFQGGAAALDDWSKDKPLDAERIASQAGIGAILGAAGPLAGEVVSGLGKGAGKALDWVDDLAKNQAPGESLLGTIWRGYQAAGKEAGDYVSTLADNLNGLYQGASSATKEMYENAGQEALGNALYSNSAEAPMLEQAKGLAQRTFENVKNRMIPGEGELPPLSPRNVAFITSNMQEAADAVNSAETPLEVHNALSDFATDIDKGIKFDKAPTAADQFDQQVIRGMRSDVRGDLRDPDLWGDAAGVYSELADNYSGYVNAQKNFQRDFMKSRTGANGQTIKVIDPVKVNNFFKDPSAPGQVLKQQSLSDFISAAEKNAKFANNYGAYQEGIDSLTNNAAVRGAEGANREALQTIQKAHKEGESGLGTLVALESLPLPTPIKATVLALKGYVRPNGGMLFGGTLAKTMKAAKWMADQSDAAGAAVTKGAKAIFRTTAAGEREE